MFSNNLTKIGKKNKASDFHQRKKVAPTGVEPRTIPPSGRYGAGRCFLCRHRDSNPSSQLEKLVS